MDYRTRHGYDGDSTGVSSSAPDTAEQQAMRTRIDALEHAVTKLTQQLAELTSPHAAAPPKAHPPTLPQRTPQQGCSTKAPAPSLTTPALAAGVPVKAPPMTQENRRKKEEEELAKEQEQGEGMRRKREEIPAAAEAAALNEVAASRGCLDARKMKENEAAKAAAEEKEEQAEEAKELDRNAFIAAEKAAARKRLKEQLTKEEEACSGSSWSGWNGNQSGWKGQQGWIEHDWGNIWKQQ